MKTYGHFIDGSYVDPIGEQWIDSHNRYTGEVWARILNAWLTSPH